uniref:Uncharacterized protein n=1 Tax=Anguilla anguilla TaxID=7936 RepID=A0A0E9RV98_ANGAN
MSKSIGKSSFILIIQAIKDKHLQCSRLCHGFPKFFLAKGHIFT